MTYRLRFISNQNDGKKTAEVTLFGAIGGWYANLENLKSDLKASGDYSEILLLINSYGGYFYDGLAIYNFIKSFNKPVTTRVMGYALSMASHIMLAGSRIECCENGLIMLHRAQGMGYGDAKSLRKEADILETHDQALLPAYAARLKISPTEVMTLLENETWYSAQQALEAGLIDAIVNVAATPVPDSTDAETLDTVNSFKNAPPEFAAQINRLNQRSKPLFSRVLNAIVSVAATPTPVITPLLDESEQDDMTPEQLAALGQTIQASITAGFEAVKSSALTPTPNPTELDDLKSQLATVQAELKTAKEKVAELSLPDPKTPNIPANTGGSVEYDC